MWPFPFVLRQCSHISDLSALGTWGLWVRDPQPTPIAPSVQVHRLITLDSQLWQAFQLQASRIFHRSLSFVWLLSQTLAHMSSPCGHSTPVCCMALWLCSHRFLHTHPDSIPDERKMYIAQRCSQRQLRPLKSSVKTTQQTLTRFYVLDPKIYGTWNDHQL